MKISDVMTPEVEVVNPDDSLRTAAELMANHDSEALPVGENDRLIGAITDHDITIRAVAEGRDPEKTTVRQAMCPDVLYCFEDEDVAEVSQKMGEWWVRAPTRGEPGQTTRRDRVARRSRCWNR